MRRNHLNFSLLTLISLSLSACASWVSLTAGGEAVSVREPSAVSACDRVGRVTARSRDEIATIDRSAERLQNELLVLARNEAATLGGDVIVPDSVIQEGSQTFVVYNCP